MSRTPADRAVATWIAIGVFMLLGQVILGGVTRLTGSGLSITEWKVITGALPPMNARDWSIEFDKYRQTPQYRLLNAGFTLSDFKFIFFWEWLHRFWARMIGVVFLIGFVYLLARGYLQQRMIKPLLILFLLGALQGAVGWIMVASGLTGDAVYVQPTRLALHCIFAMALIAYALWFLLDVGLGREARVAAPGEKRFVLLMMALVAVQLVFGALMAGHKAATAAPTWPDINGSFVPAGLLREQPAAVNFINNKITIHFVHRMLAYVILLLTLWFTIRARRIFSERAAWTRLRAVPLVLVCVQVLLGIASLLTSPSIVPNRWGAFEWFAQLHQITGLLLALSFVSLYYLLSPRQQRRVSA